MIDSHLNSSRRSRLCQQYRQIKELQKAISTGIETIASKYSQANRQINKLTEQIINQIKKRQKATFTALQKQKLQIIQKIDKNWGDFKGYALVMRRIYFGQSQSQKLPPFNLQSMKEILLELNKKENKIGQLVNNFRRLHENISQKEEKYLQQRYHQSQQFKPMTQKDIDISPIKLKKRENNTNVQKNNEYEHINHSKILLFQECFKQSEHKNDSQFKLLNAQNDQKNSENQQTRNLPSKVTHQLEKLKMSKPLIQNQDKIISLSSAKSDDRQFSNRLKAVKSSDRVYSANIMSNFSAKVMSNARSQRQLNYPNYSHKNSYLQYKNKNSQRVYFCEKSQLFSQKQQKSLVKRSYKGCLQKLQKQQLQYEKIRHTFQ